MGRHIGRGLLGRVAELRTRLLRVRYFRGHGVHSPYIYAIVRNVFMQRSLLAGDRGLYELLLAEGVSERRAVQLQNLAIHCGYASYGLHSAAVEFCVVTHGRPVGEVLVLLRDAAMRGTTVAVLAPYEGRAWQMMCRQIVADHPSMSVDNRAYLLIFNNHLPKQHLCI